MESGTGKGFPIHSVKKATIVVNFVRYMEKIVCHGIFWCGKGEMKVFMVNFARTMENGTFRGQFRAVHGKRYFAR